MAEARVQKVLAIISEWQKRMAQLADDDAEGYEILARKMEQRIIRVVRGQGPATKKAQASVLNEIRVVLRNGAREAIALSDDTMLRILAASLDRDGKAFDVLGVRTKRVSDAITHFSEAIESKQILRTLEPYRTRWREEWQEHWTPTLRRVQAEFSRGVLLRSHSNQIADAIQGELGTLQIAGQQDPRVFARGFVRAKMTEINSDFSQVLGKDAGMEQYVNIGVMDDRQSQVCYEACNAGPMTLEEWDAWRSSSGEGGRPPRHVLYCRCTLLAIPNVIAEDDWTQPNPKFSEVAA